MCAWCGVATTYPWPTEDELSAAYTGWYRPAAGRFGRFGDTLFNRVRAQRSQLIDDLAPPGPILDVGAGEGTLIDALRDRGRDAVGLDPYTGRSDFLAIEPEAITGEWAAIVFWHSLEHLRAPTRALRAAASALRPGGLLLIAIPNPSSIQARIFGDRWFPLDLPRHLVHVPAHALLGYLRQLELEIRRVSYLRGGQVVFGWLHGLVGSISPRLDMYDALRIKEARSREMPPPVRITTIVLGVLLFPLACIGSIIEVVARRSGTLYVEAIAWRVESS
ncbi:MAG: class I SAM-dependent methyltransferase [Actinobacteria bacterium]|nr:class I SAM-dependent methyltransferase [Actinomycetota bacterium]